MKVIGITGGVGAGKSEVLAYLSRHYNCRVIMADKVAHQLEEPGERCFEPLKALLGIQILNPEGRIDRQKMAARIFGDVELLGKVNAIVHPAVKAYLLEQIALEKEANKFDFLFIEAALLIEDGYTEIVDELWYIHADTDVRRQRLRKTRGYSDEKIDSILRGQLPEEAFYEHCGVVIENSGTLAGVYQQIEKELGEYQCQKQ
ncbi:dephospho-CoA kinase [bacterium 0.1xD8-71]|nr:dephospho-CoA kinase [bacterium 0.1xD8-71]